MEAEGGGAGGVAEDAAGQASLGDPGSQVGPGGHEDPGGPGRGDSGEAGASDSLATQLALAIVTSGLGADAWPEPSGHDESTVGRPEGHRLQFYLIVPFPSPMEAEMASRLLMPHVQSQEGAGVKELTVSDNNLTVRLTGEDPFEIRHYISSCLDQLSLMAFPPCFFIEPTLERGA